MEFMFLLESFVICEVIVMENVITGAVGVLLIVLGYFIGVRRSIKLVHSYHYKRVPQKDIPSFCKGVGLGNLIVGIGLVIFPIVNIIIGEIVALRIVVVLLVIGLIIAISTIIKYNKWLF